MFLDVAGVIYCFVDYFALGDYSPPHLKAEICVDAVLDWWKAWFLKVSAP